MLFLLQIRDRDRMDSYLGQTPCCLSYLNFFHSTSNHYRPRKVVAVSKWIQWNQSFLWWFYVNIPLHYKCTSMFLPLLLWSCLLLHLVTLSKWAFEKEPCRQVRISKTSKNTHSFHNLSACTGWHIIDYWLYGYSWQNTLYQTRLHNFRWNTITWTLHSICSDILRQCEYGTA